MLGESLIQIHRDADIIAIVFKLEDIHDRKDYNRFEVHCKEI
jgi:hypothetical protein